MDIVGSTRWSFCIAALLTLLSLTPTASTQLVSTGQTLVLNNVPYYVPATAFTALNVKKLRGLPSADGLVPITVVGSSADLQATVQGYGQNDDVWSAGFLEG